MTDDARLAEVCEAIVDCPHSTPIWTDSGVVVLRNQNIRNGRLDLSEPSYTDEAHFAERTRRALPTEGDLVITREAPMGEVCLIPRGLRSCLGQRMVLLRPNRRRVHPRYLLYALQTKQVQNEIRVNEGTGSTVSNLRIPLLEGLRVPMHPLSEQYAIADILGVLDDKIRLNHRTNETLETMARALFKSWFVHFDPVHAKAEGRDPNVPKALADVFPKSLESLTEGERPTGWEVRRWGDLVALKYGKSLQTYTDQPEGFPVYGTNGPIGWTAEPLCKHPGIIIGRKGAYRGVHFSPTPFWPIDTAFYIEPITSLEMRWAYYELLRFDLNGMDSGSAIPSTSRESFLSIPVVVPPPEVQREFVRILDPVWARQDQGMRESQTLGSLRDALLPKLISGELRIKDAERFLEGTMS